MQLNKNSISRDIIIVGGTKGIGLSKGNI